MFRVNQSHINHNTLCLPHIPCLFRWKSVAAPDFGISEPSNGLKNEGRDLEGYRFPRGFCFRFPGDFCFRQLYCRKHHQPAGGCAKNFRAGTCSRLNPAWQNHQSCMRRIQGSIMDYFRCVWCLFTGGLGLVWTRFGFWYFFRVGLGIIWDCLRVCLGLVEVLFRVGLDLI